MWGLRPHSCRPVTSTASRGGEAESFFTRANQTHRSRSRRARDGETRRTRKQGSRISEDVLPAARGHEFVQVFHAAGCHQRIAGLPHSGQHGGLGGENDIAVEGNRRWRRKVEREKSMARRPASGESLTGSIRGLPCQPIWTDPCVCWTTISSTAFQVPWPKRLGGVGITLLANHPYQSGRLKSRVRPSRRRRDPRGPTEPHRSLRERSA